MLSFVSTFPPAMCGIGTYTHYVTRPMPANAWRVIAFRLDEFSRCNGERDWEIDPRVRYWIALEDPCLPPFLEGEVVWFQHSFGMWGRVNTHFVKLIGEAKDRGKKVGASFHTIHFQSRETPWGMQQKEWRLLQEALPLLDFVTVFTEGAYRAVTKAFPHSGNKVVVLRHGVHTYPKVSKDEARERLLRYLIERSPIPAMERERLERMKGELASQETILLGNYGFITQDKDPLRLYEFGRLVQRRLPSRRVVTLFVGKIQERKDRNKEAYLPILQELKRIHDGTENLFYEDFIPESVFPFAFRALDFAVFWCENATQSGRMAHAQGTGVPIVGRRWEGVGETLELSGLPAATTLEELADRVSEIMSEPKLMQQMEESNRRYSERFSFQEQARKHLILEEAVRKGMGLPVLDGGVGDDFHIGKVGSRGFGRFGESSREIGIGA